MNLIIGLGNPGEQYKYTRHNAGFLIIDKIAKHYHFEKFKNEKKLKSQIAKGNIAGTEIILVKPQTFMNNSGEAVLACKNFFKVSLENLLIIHDDIDIETGKIKSALGSGSAGHNGVKSIINLLGTKEFKRIRIGIDSRKNGLWQKVFGKIPTDKFVLGNFQQGELDILENIFDKVVVEIIK